MLYEALGRGESMSARDDDASRSAAVFSHRKRPRSR